MSELLSHSALGKSSIYQAEYNPGCLYPIPRADKRRELGIETACPFYGFDCWTHYEVSWLNAKGKPMVAIAEIIYNCESPQLIESKSLKLYFNSFNNTAFDNADQLKTLIIKDLSERIGAEIEVVLYSLKEWALKPLPTFVGNSLDELDVNCSIYTTEPAFLSVGPEFVTETLCSDLLKSNCPVTNQPDWGSVQISYQGKKMDRAGLLRYLVSFRNHNEFHEQCIERIFMDLMRHCQPEKLTVYGRYTRRGGLDINPCRSTEKLSYQDYRLRLVRQ